MGGMEADGACDGIWQEAEASDKDAASNEASGSGLDRVAWRGFGASLGLVGSVWVLFRVVGRASVLGASELGVDIRGPVRFGRGSGDGLGLVFGDCGKSGD